MAKKWNETYQKAEGHVVGCVQSGSEWSFILYTSCSAISSLSLSVIVWHCLPAFVCLCVRLPASVWLGWGGSVGFASRRAMLHQLHGVSMYSHEEHHTHTPAYSWGEKGKGVARRGSWLCYGRPLPRPCPFVLLVSQPFSLFLSRANKLRTSPGRKQIRPRYMQRYILYISQKYYCLYYMGIRVQ